MAELSKVYRGMQNGAETINDNFNKVNTELDNAVHKTGDESISGKKTFTDDASFKNIQVSETIKTKNLQVTSSISASSTIYKGDGQIVFYRVGNMVQANVRSVPAVPSATSLPGVIPAGYRPAYDFSSVTKAGNRLNFYADGHALPDGSALASADGYYSCSWPTTDAMPTT